MTDAMLTLFDEGELPSVTYVQSTERPASPALIVAPPIVTAPPITFRPRTSHLQRIVADSTDRVAWLRARSQGITATDVAKLATPKSVQNAAYDKMHGTSFGGNSYTDHGRAREPEIAAWVRRNYGIEPSTALFRSESHSRHLATPDGVVQTPTGELELAEIKTTSKAWRSIPRSYLRQVWWQQYVLGAERTLVVWEQHTDFVPVNDEPECQWVDRDEDQIAILVGFANQLIDILDRQATKNAQYPPYDDYR
ncbi:YqaJ viral recombinase family protein [Leifsonia sp. A12D58]|uniref:YqaJ viral recombinase family protein n=1 Tax=Leifsonia sp. A12D58 TaxID=3397674 RepID=UPI0039E0212C